MITIIVVVILAVAVILSIANNNPIENAKEATQKNNDAVLLEQANVIYSYWYQEHQLGKITEDDAETYVRNELKKQGFEKYDYVHINDGKVASVLYKELEYIESTGTQYIDTGYHCNPRTRIIVCFQMKNIMKTQQRVFGNGGRLITSLYTSDGLQFGYAYSDTESWHYTNIAVNKDKNVFDIDAFSKTARLNQEYFSINTSDKITESSTRSLTIFDFNIKDRNIEKYGAECKIYYFKILENDELVMDLVPCNNTSGVLGMYDKVKGRFLSNLGTGVFLPGPEV